MTAYPPYDGVQASVNAWEQRTPQAGGRGLDPRIYMHSKDRSSTLPRSISAANLDKLDYCREVMMRDLVTKPPLGGTSFFASTSNFTLALPSLDNNPRAFKKFVYDSLTDQAMQKHLEQGHVLNWCDSVSEVVPLNTLRDGNCLLHAASLAMWGFQDRTVTLRRALSTALTFLNNTLYDRWKYNRESENQRMGLELESGQWDAEWQAMVRQASSDVQIGKNFESLDDFHIFILANVLRRPIILYAASKIHSMQSGGTLQEINFQGVYLPLLWEPATCKKNPLPLAYDGGHFCALVVTESAKRYHDGQYLFSLLDYYGKQLTIKFTLPVEDDTSLVMDYLKPVQIEHGGSPYVTTPQIVCARLDVATPPNYLKSLVANFVDACWQVFSATNKPENGRGGESVRLKGEGPTETGGGGERMKCINNCGRYGDDQHSFMCMECHQKARERELESRADHSPPLVPRDRPNSREHPNGNRRGESSQYHVAHKDPPTSSKGGGTSLGTVKCPQCAEPGFPQLLGMCERCYGNNIGNQGEAIYERLPSEGGAQGGPNEPPAVPLPRNAKETSLCRKPGCKYYGSVEKRFYCSRCFESDMENILKEADEGPPIRPETPNASPTRTKSGQQFPTHNTFSPTRSKSGQQPLTPDTFSPARSKSGKQPQPSASGNEPPKCSRCQEFYADEAYVGLCNDCFMKSTLSGGSAPHSPQSSERKQSKGAGMQPSGCQDGTDRFYNPTAPKRIYDQVYEPPQGAGRSTRVPSNPTAPVTDLESKMADMNMSSRCFMCNGGQMGDSAQFTVCRDHAKDMFRLMQSKKEEVGREGEVQHKPSYKPQAAAFQVQPYEVPQRTGSGVRATPHEAAPPYGNEPRRKSASFGRNDFDNPHYQSVNPQRSGSVSEQDRAHRGADPTPPLGYETERRGREAEWGYPSQQSPGYGNGQQYGNEQGWPPSSGVYEQPRDPGGRYGNELNYPPQQGHGSDQQGRRQTNDLAANEQGHARREAEWYGQQRQGPPRPQAEGRGAEGVSSATEAKPKVKSLCARTGCSFKGYEPLAWLCPDCYIEEYKKYPDFYSPDEFPLV